MNNSSSVNSSSNSESVSVILPSYNERENIEEAVDRISAALGDQLLEIIIIDDEIAAIENLQILLNKYCNDIEVVATASSADEGFELINEENPDLIFLDIEMPHANGFDLLKRFTNPTFSVIFTTAYNQYAIQAIKFSALDYLLKPIDVDELITAVSKVEEKSQVDDNRVNVLLENIDTKTSQYLSQIKQEIHNKINNIYYLSIPLRLLCKR